MELLESPSVSVASVASHAQFLRRNAIVRFPPPTMHNTTKPSAAETRKYLEDNFFLLLVLLISPFAFVVYLYFFADE